ncbi:hypothetical protein A2U01_0031692, partial [Trifolium medium]|nr:hypothetical protein [Trifolium medium]
VIDWKAALTQAANISGWDSSIYSLLAPSLSVFHFDLRSVAG